MTNCIKPSLFTFEQENTKRFSKKLRNSDEGDSTLIRLNMKDIQYKRSPKPSERPLKYFSLSVTAKLNYSLCEITENIMENSPKKDSDRSKFIDDFYTRKKVSNKLKKIDKNLSVEKIPDQQTNTLQENRIRTIYYSEKKTSRFIPQTVKTFLKVPEVVKNINIPKVSSSKPVTPRRSGEDSQNTTEKSGNVEKKTSHKSDQKTLPAINKVRKSKKNNNCMSIQTDEPL